MKRITSHFTLKGVFMKRFISHSLFVSCFTIVFIVTAMAQESYKLEYKYEKGKTYRYNTSSSGNMTQEMMGKEMKMTNGSDMTVRMVVENVLNDGGFVLITSVDSGKITTKSQMMDTTMAMSGAIGKRTRVTMSKIGVITAHEVVDTVKNEGMTGPATQRGLMSATRLPVMKVKIGDTWNSSSVDTIESMGGKIYHNTDMTYTLVGKENKQNHDCLKIEYTGTSSDTGKMMMGGMELYLEGNGKVKGAVYFDHKLGLVILDESTTDTEQTMAVTGQTNMTIPISQTMKTTRVLLEK